MFVRFFCMLLAMLLALQVTGGAAQAQAIGQIASASGAGLVQTAAGRAALKPGLRLSVGDVVTTDTGGKAQLAFDDGTKIVVGPGSRLVIEEILMQSGGTAERFAVSAVGGTFRFISGKSAKKAYAITTPTATMGIRGTSFDFSVRQREGTNLVLFKGAVRMCGLNGQCAEIRGRCTLITLKGRGQFSGLTGEENLEAKDNVIVEDFPFVLDQAPLRREFRAPVGSCGDVESRVAARAAQKAGVAAPSAALPDRAGASDNVERETPTERRAPEPERPDPPKLERPDPPEPERPDPPEPERPDPPEPERPDPPDPPDPDPPEPPDTDPPEAP